MFTLFTFGYGGATVEDLKRFARDGALILDIRYKPASRIPIWTRLRLSEALGTSYLHERRLGNVNYKGDLGPDVQLLDAENGLDALETLLRTRPVVLLCVCKDRLICHRSVVAELVQARHPEVVVVHLKPGDQIGASPAPAHTARGGCQHCLTF